MSNIDTSFLDRFRLKLDRIETSSHDEAMPSDLTRPEIDARFKESGANLAAAEAKVDARLANFDTSIKTGFAEMRADMAKMSGDIRVEMANIRTDVHRNTVELIKWTVGIAIAGVGMTVGLLTYINKPSVPTTPTSVSAPASNAIPPAELKTAPPK